ncbi:MAG TPA: tyrosine-type recombinase/integrase [Brumimicrobium sp.]|nr:tyrosine-type recombinase/integrase [Brumimicrobium sp.]
MLNQYLLYLKAERRVSTHTLTAYKKDIEQFLSFTEVESVSDLREVNHQIIRSWIVDLVEKGDTNRTVNRKLSSLRTFFKWARSMGMVESNPMLKVKGPKQEKRLPEFVKQEEIAVEKLNEVFPTTFSGLRDRLLIEVLYQSGIRLSELINLKPSSIQNQSIKVLGKGNKERIIPLTDTLSEQLRSYLDSPTYKELNPEFLFVLDNGKKMYPNFVYRKVKFYLSLLTSLKKKSPHILRHTFATHMLNNGAGLEVLKDILGHASLSATQIYTHNSFDQIAKIYEKSHPRGEKE